MLCILISAMSCVVPAVARLGETPEECEKRYGEGKETAVRLGEELKERGAGWTAATYLTRGLEVQVVFDGGKAVIVTYGNQPMFRLGEGGGSTVNLTADEIDRLKEVNVDGAQWRPYTTATMRKVAPG